MSKREDIMQAALELFSERGFHGTPVPLLAQRAGVGAGTIYRYFKDKESLVNELYRHWKLALKDAAARGVDGSGPFRSMFLRIFNNIFDFAEENREAYTFLVAHHHAPYLDRETKELADGIHAGFIEKFHMGCEGEVLKKLPPVLLLAMVTGVISEALKEVWAGRVTLTPELKEELAEACWQAVRR